MPFRTVLTAAVIVLCATAAVAAPQTNRSAQTPPETEAVQEYPPIVLYSVAWCSYCKDAKRYMTSRNIPFTNRDVEADIKAMDEMREKYSSSSVPVLVLGSGRNEVVLRGFSPEILQNGLAKFRKRN